AIASGKGGVGKSTIAVNTAIWMAPRRPTVLVDGDLGTANADVLCGLAPARRLDAELFRTGEPDLASLLIDTPWGFGLVPGAAGTADAAQLETRQRSDFIRAIDRLGTPGDAVITDLGAGIGASVIETVAASGLGVIVTTAEPSSLADAYALIKCVTRHRGDPRPLGMGLVVNMIESRSVGRAVHDRIDRVCRRFLGGSMPLLGLIRRDRRVAASVRTRTPLLAGNPHGPAARDLQNLADLIAAIAPRNRRSGTEDYRS
ncbi:MAG: P-loop NTPase, partial [Phycisphaerales bacterium]|nr:P-loop NTPase [Phycisphaerales bacterium]